MHLRMVKKINIMCILPRQKMFSLETVLQQERPHHSIGGTTLTWRMKGLRPQSLRKSCNCAESTSLPSLPCLASGRMCTRPHLKQSCLEWKSSSDSLEIDQKIEKWQINWKRACYKYVRLCVLNPLVSCLSLHTTLSPEQSLHNILRKVSVRWRHGLHFKLLKRIIVSLCPCRWYVIDSLMFGRGLGIYISWVIFQCA